VAQYYLLKWQGQEPTQESYLEGKVDEYENLLASRNETTATTSTTARGRGRSSRRGRQSTLLPLHRQPAPPSSQNLSFHSIQTAP